MGFYHERGTPVRLRVYGLGLRRCKILIVPSFRGSSRFESLIISRHSRFTCECNQEEMNNDDDGVVCGVWGSGFWVEGLGCELRVLGLEFQDLGFGVWDLWFRL